LIPKTEMATAMANSKLLLAAVNEIVAVLAYPTPVRLAIKNEMVNITRK